MKIALALSGGGYRATVFHLGMIARLAVDENDLLSQVTHLSTVSGGSLCGGLVYTLNGFKWPDANQYLNEIVPEARRLLTSFDVQGALIGQTLSQIWTLFQPRTGALSRLMRKQWGVTARLADIPQEPRWLINTCCYETGKNFRFEPHRMGDYITGYARPKDFLLADTLAASAGFPGLIGYLPLKTSDFSWYKYKDKMGENLFLPVDHPHETVPIQPAFKKLHLWDGGAYDNQGLEGLMDFETGWRSNIDFLVISEATPKADPVNYSWGVPALYRLATGIMMEQVRSLRARVVIEQMRKHAQPGSYVRIGNTCEYVLNAANQQQYSPNIVEQCLDSDQVELAAHTPTMIRKLTQEEFERLFRHGYETCDYTLFAHHAEPNAKPVQFKFLGYEAVKPRLGK